MPRDFQAVHRKLQEAALALFGQRGYEQTTAALIAARAGVTERTFFRHFADKRDILFDGEARLLAAMTDAIDSAPADCTSMQALRLAFRAAGEIFEENRAFAEPRQQVIAATPALREREAGKAAAMTAALATALERRGAEAGLAMLAVQVGSAVFSYALTGWFQDTTEELDVLLDRGFDRIRTMSADSGGS